MADFNIQDILKRIKLPDFKGKQPINLPKEGTPEVMPLYAIKTPDGDGFEPKGPGAKAVYAVLLPPEGSRDEAPKPKLVYGVNISDQPVQDPKRSLVEWIKVLFGKK